MIDLSPEYIKLCSLAEEIQKSWKPKEWDYYCGEKNNDPWDNEEKIDCIIPDRIADSGVYGISPENFDTEGKDRFVTMFWLPRQDQLQEMINGQYNIWIYKNKGEILWNIFTAINGKSQEFNRDSLEKCLIEIVMGENFNKTWNGNNWEKINV